VSIGGVDGFPLRAESVGARMVWCIPFGNVSFDFLWCVTEFQRGGVSVSGAAGLQESMMSFALLESVMSSAL